MMHRLGTIVLFLPFFLITFQGNFVLLDYRINLDSFLRECINRSKPQLGCKGKCQMTMRLQERESQSKEGDAIPKSGSFSPISSKSFFQVLIEPWELQQKSHVLVVQSVFLLSFFRDIFHPPRKV
jgi:hypothetical protein